MITNTPVPARTAPRYYRSFLSYEVPFRPEDPVEFADTEGLKSFYAAYFDEAGRVVRFDKLRLVRADKKPRELPLPIAAPPASTVYFEVVRDPAPSEPSPGKQLSYQETEPLNEFFAGKPDSTGWRGMPPCSGRRPRFRTSTSIGRQASCERGR